eukprot:306661-Chlamydomonas_euryale.AAC.1
MPRPEPEAAGIPAGPPAGLPAAPGPLVLEWLVAGMHLGSVQGLCASAVSTCALVLQACVASQVVVVVAPHTGIDPRCCAAGAAPTGAPSARQVAACLPMQLLHRLQWLQRRLEQPLSMHAPVGADADAMQRHAAALCGACARSARVAGELLALTGAAAGTDALHAHERAALALGLPLPAAHVHAAATRVVADMLGSVQDRDDNDDKDDDVVVVTQ